MRMLILSIIAMSIGEFADSSERYIRIDSPGDNDRINPAQPIAVTGSGKGLFEGNVVVRMEDVRGRVLAQVPTTMRRSNIAAEGTWGTRVTLPQSPPTRIRLIAYSPSPKEGDAAITSKPLVLRTTRTKLESSYWQLRSYQDESGEMALVPPEIAVDARFSGDEIGGSAGCNRYFSRYTAGDENRLMLASQIGTTQMACSAPVHRLEQRYLALLSAVSVWRVDEESLVLLDNNGRSLLKYVAGSPAVLEHQRWYAIGINNGRGGVVSADTTHLATALFADEKVTGTTGCNRFTGHYEIKGSRIAIGPVMTSTLR